MSRTLRLGMIGLDTSHVTAFASLLNDEANQWHVPGGRVVAAYPGGSADFALSASRVGKFTAEMQEKYSVQILPSPEAVAEAVDLLMIESVDGRVHLEQFGRTIRYRKPTFIDKPIATTLADAEAIFRMASEAGVAVMSSSSLRFTKPLVDALTGAAGAVLGCDAFGPMAEESTQPGLLWYGIHSVEMLVRVMGLGCREVRACRNEGNDLVTLVWGDGRVASLRGLRGAHSKFGVTLHYKGEARFVDAGASPKPLYAGLLEAIMQSLPQGKMAVPLEETIEVMRIIEATNRSRVNGEVVRLAE